MLVFLFQCVGLCTLFILSACTSSKIRPTQYAQTLTKSSKKEPCWIKQPHCKGADHQEMLYFVGQSANPIAHWGQPKRESLRSAMADAEAQYARFLGVQVQSSIKLAEVQNESEYQSQVSQQVSTKVNQLVSDLMRVDEHFVAYQETDDGQPLWTVYVLVQIPRSTIKQHRLIINEKANAQKKQLRQQDISTKLNTNKQRKTTQIRRQELWTAKVFNVDDTATIYVNGTVIRQCEFSRTCSVELNPHLKLGSNLVELKFGNRLGFWTYGYEVRKDDKLLYQAKCGQVWVFGCKWNVSHGLVHQFEFKIMKDDG